MNERTIRAEMLLGAVAMEKLRRAHVAVFGLGGVGSWCAEALARSGVGQLTLIDQDTVGLSNINRQLCALTSTLDMPKAEVLRRRIEDIGPDIVVHTIVGRYEAANREDFFADYDYIVDCIDLVSCKVDLIREATERGIPIISAGGCPLARVVRRELRKLGIEHHDVVFSPEEAMKPEQFEAPPPGRRSVPGSLVWVPASAGLLLCQHVVLTIADESRTPAALQL